MLSRLSIINLETNKLLILNSTHISTKLLSTIPSHGKPTWRITYEDEDEDLEYNDLNQTKKGFGKITVNDVSSRKNDFKINSVNSKLDKNSISNSKIEIPVQKDKILNKKNIKGKQNKKYNNPEFEIIKSTNSESVLFAKMKQNSLFYAKYGTVVGLSSKVKIELSYEDNTDEVLKGGNGSGIFAFEKVWTEDNSGQVLLVPVNGDLMLIDIDKNKEYIVKGKALFGAVSTIHVNDYFHNNHKFEGVKYFIVKGKGTIAIEGEGGVLEITLNEDEHFLVKPSTLLAFESQMSVKPVLSSACTEDVDEEIFENNNDNSFWKKAKGMVDRAKIYVSGDQLFYKLKGPGKFYISTRIPTLSGIQSFKLNNKDKKLVNKNIQKRNYSTNARSQLLDEYEPELENEISTLQKKLMEKTLNKQIKKKSKKNNRKNATSNKKSSNDRYPTNLNQDEDDTMSNSNELPSASSSTSTYQNLIDEKAVLYKKSDKVKCPKPSMFFTSRESNDEKTVEKPLIKTPKKNSIDVYLDEDVGEALIKENKKYKNNNFSLGSHQNKSLKLIINSEEKENKDRSVNSKLERRTAEIKAEKRRKRQQELNPNRYLNNEEEEEEDIEEDNDEIVDDNEEEIEDDEEYNEEENDDEIVDEDDNDNDDDNEIEEEEGDNDDGENDEEIEEEEVEDVEDVEEIEEEEEEDIEEIKDVDDVNDEKIEEEEEEIPKPISKKSKNDKKIQKKPTKKTKVIKIKNESSEPEKKVWTMKENIKENKFFTFNDKNSIPLTAAALSKSSPKKNDSETPISKSSLKKKSPTKKIKRSSNLSKQSNSSSRKSSSLNGRLGKRNMKINNKSPKSSIKNRRSVVSASKTRTNRTITRKPQQNKRINEKEEEFYDDDEFSDNEEYIENEDEEEIIEDDDNEYIEDDDEEYIEDEDNEEVDNE